MAHIVDLHAYGVTAERGFLPIADPNAAIPLANAEWHETARNLPSLIPSGKIRAIIERLPALLLPPDPNDGRDVLIEVRPGAGGDEAAIFARMTGELGYSIRKLADKIGKDKGYVENRLRLNSAPHDVRNLVASRSDTISHAYELMKVDDVGTSYIVGGSPNQIRVEPDPERLSQYGVTLNQLIDKLTNANRSFQVGAFREGNRSIPVVAGQTLQGGDARCAVRREVAFEQVDCHVVLPR